MTKPKTIEVARSYSRKVQVVKFEDMRDFFASRKAECAPEEAAEVSDWLFEECVKDVDRAIEKSLPQPETSWNVTPPVATGKTKQPYSPMKPCKGGCGKLGRYCGKCGGFCCREHCDNCQNCGTDTQDPEKVEFVSEPDKPINEIF